MRDKKREKKEKSEGISVCVRIRPLNAKERKNCSAAWKVDGSTITQIHPGGGKPLPSSSYTFDRVYGAEHDTSNVFEHTAKVYYLFIFYFYFYFFFLFMWIPKYSTFLFLFRELSIACWMVFTEPSLPMDKQAQERHTQCRGIKNNQESFPSLFVTFSPKLKVLIFFFFFVLFFLFFCQI